MNDLLRFFQKRGAITKRRDMKYEILIIQKCIEYDQTK